MTFPRVVVLLALIVGCVRKPYYPAGSGGPQNVTGSYELVETLNSSSCGPVSVRKQRIHIQVEHQPGSSLIKLIEEGRPWDARLLPNGTVTVVTPLRVQTPQAIYTTGFTGRFTDSTFTARVDVRVQDLTPRSRADSRPSECTYQLFWSGIKL